MASVHHPLMLKLTFEKGKGMTTLGLSESGFSLELGVEVPSLRDLMRTRILFIKKGQLKLRLATRGVRWHPDERSNIWCFCPHLRSSW